METLDDTRGEEASDDEVVVRARNLVCGYGETVILEDIDIDIHRGEIVTLLGGSGSGKSTLLKTLVGLLPPLGGTIEILGKNPFDLDEHEHAELLRRTGMMFQHGALFGSQTVYENISMPLREHTDVPEPVIEEMVRMKLALVGLRGLENRLPSDISGGQRKRVALVRASILDPDIVFADEPSAGLDPIAAAGLDRVLRRFQDLFNMTLVVVTHELDSIEILADRVVMLEDGNVVTTGTVEELRNSEIESVRNFFQRNPPEYLESGKGASVWTELQS